SERRLAEERKPATDASIASANSSANNASGSNPGSGPGTNPGSNAGNGGANSGGASSGSLGGGAKSVETRAIVPVSLAPPDALRTVAQDFVKGRYREAREGLQSQAVPTEWRAHAALLR